MRFFSIRRSLVLRSSISRACAPLPLPMPPPPAPELPPGRCWLADNESDSEADDRASAPAVPLTAEWGDNIGLGISKLLLLLLLLLSSDMALDRGDKTGLWRGCPPVGLRLWSPRDCEPPPNDAMDLGVGMERARSGGLGPRLAEGTLVPALLLSRVARAGPAANGRWLRVDTGALPELGAVGWTGCPFPIPGRVCAGACGGLAVRDVELESEVVAALRRFVGDLVGD